MPFGSGTSELRFDVAPAGTRVRFATLLSFVIVALLLCGILASVLATRRPPPWPMFMVIAIAPLIVGLTWLGAHIRQYRIAGDELLVEMSWRVVRFPLAGLQEVTIDSAAMQGARKIAGNDGLRAVTGRFRSRRLGRFRAFLTDPVQAVVLRWPDRCLVVSPARPAYFIETVRRRAGLPC